MIERLLLLRAEAMRQGDYNLAREILTALTRAGWTEVTTLALENASQPRPKGRPRKAPVEAA
jgi:hypothetical protein